MLGEFDPCRPSGSGAGGIAIGSVSSGKVPSRPAVSHEDVWVEETTDDIAVCAGWLASQPVALGGDPVPRQTESASTSRAFEEVRHSDPSSPEKLGPSKETAELFMTPDEVSNLQDSMGTSGPSFGKKHFVVAASVCSSDPDAMSTTPGPVDEPDSDYPFARMLYRGPDIMGKVLVQPKHRHRRNQARGKKRPSTYKDEVDCLRLQAGLDLECAY